MQVAAAGIDNNSLDFANLKESQYSVLTRSDLAANAALQRSGPAWNRCWRSKIETCESLALPT